MYVKTMRLELKPIAHQGLENLVTLLTDEGVGQTYMVPDFADREEAERLARRLMALSEGQRLVAGIWMEEELVGILNETEVLGDRIELGYAVLPQYQNRGIAAEALRGAVEYCFAKGFREVTAGAFEENIPSIRVMEKCGMERNGLTENIEYRGRTHRCVYYSIIRKSC